MELGRNKLFKDLISRLARAKPEDGPVKVAGTWGSFAHLLAVFISKQIGRGIVYVCPHVDDADKAVDDIHTFGGKTVESFGAWQGSEDIPDATDEIRTDRLRVVLKMLAHKEKNFIVTTSIQALCQPVPKRESLQAGRLDLTVNKNLTPESIAGWLIDNGFEQVERIDLPGQLARRGGIVDIYAPLIESQIEATQNAQAIRIEFFGDMIESIRQIDLDTHRSKHQIDTISIISAICGTAPAQSELFINIIPKDTIIILQEPGDIEEVASIFLQRSESPEKLYQWDDIYKAFQNFTQLHIGRFTDLSREDFINTNIKSIQQFQHKAGSLWSGGKEALQELVDEAGKGKNILLYCESQAQITRITEIVTQDNQTLPKKLKLLLGFIHQGFVIDQLNTIIISHHELFG
ncbi:MAG: hypothetical protein ACYST9_04360, partial [Planctomycetota bacterium]